MTKTFLIVLHERGIYQFRRQAVTYLTFYLGQGAKVVLHLNLKIKRTAPCQLNLGSPKNPTAKDTCDCPTALNLLSYSLQAHWDKIYCPTAVLNQIQACSTV
jgi:hypothetical protein